MRRWPRVQSVLPAPLQEFDGASRGNPGPAGAGAVLLEDGSRTEVQAPGSLVTPPPPCRSRQLVVDPAVVIVGHVSSSNA